MIFDYIRQRKLGLRLIVFVLFFDQLTKSWALANLGEGGQTLIEGFLKYSLAMNRGVSFSFLAEIPHDWLPLALASFAGIVSLFFTHDGAGHAPLSCRPWVDSWWRSWQYV